MVPFSPSYIPTFTNLEALSTYDHLTLVRLMHLNHETPDKLTWKRSPMGIKSIESWANETISGEAADFASIKLNSASPVNMKTSFQFPMEPTVYLHNYLNLEWSKIVYWTLDIWLFMYSWSKSLQPNQQET